MKFKKGDILIYNIDKNIKATITSIDNGKFKIKIDDGRIYIFSYSELSLNFKLHERGKKTHPLTNIFQ